MVNLLVIDENGGTHSRTNVPLVQEGDPVPTGTHCQWPPYQAAGTEAAERALAGSRA